MAEMLLTIETKETVFSPPIIDEIKIEWERSGAPGKLTFTTLKVDNMDFHEGDAVCFYYDKKEVFMGYVFSKKRDKKQQIEVVCYDQIRYLKNKYTYVFEKKTATQIIQAMCKDYNLKTGSMDDTKFVIPAVCEENKASLDIILGTLEDTLLKTGKMYVLYDDFGKLKLTDAEYMMSETLIASDTAEDYEYSSSIDNDTYNSIVLYYKPKQEGTAQSASSSGGYGGGGSGGSSTSAGAAKVIQVAASQVGNKEEPMGSNRQKYGVAMGYNGVAWCCIFCWWCFREAGLSHLFYGGSKVAACRAAMSWFQSRGQFHKSNPKPGDLVFFDFQGSGVSHHIGIVESVKTDGSIVTIEGNTSNRVMRLTRRGCIMGYGRPAYGSSNTRSASADSGSGDSSSSSSSSSSGDSSTKIQVFTASNKDKISEWGTLRYFEEIDNPSGGQAKANQLLKLYCRKSREFKVTGAFGDVTVRGGTLIPVRLGVGDVNINNYMLVEKVTHIFKNDHHTMDLTLEGAWE